MKAPSRNITASLKSQRIPARGPLQVEVSEQVRGGPSMTVPGEGGVEAEPAPRHERSAAVFTEPMSRFGGKR
jgi:hypothetical protein